MKKKEEFIRVGTTLYKIVNQPRIGCGYVKKVLSLAFGNRNEESLRATIPLIV